MVSSDGELQLFTPVADDDHIDATAGRRGGAPAIAIQVKTARDVDRHGLVEARAEYPAGQVREHPAFSMQFSCSRRLRLKPRGLSQALTSIALLTGLHRLAEKFWSSAAIHALRLSAK